MDTTTLRVENQWKTLDAFQPFTQDRVRELRGLGWAALGLVAAVLDFDDNLLVLRHRGSHKTTDGAIGPLAETAKALRLPSGVLLAECHTETLARGLTEEVGLAEPVTLQARVDHPYFTFAWPAGRTGKHAYALCPVLRCEEPDQLISGFEANEEVQTAEFRSIPDVLATQNVRPGTHNWLRSLVDSPAFRSYDPSQIDEYTIHPTTPQDNYVDIHFDTLKV